MVLGRGRLAALAALLCTGAFSACSCEDRLIAMPRLVEGNPVGDRVHPVALPPRSIDLSVEDALGCSGDALQLRVEPHFGQAPFTYTWTPATGLSDPTVADPIATGSDTIVYTVRVVDASGRWAEREVRVERHALPEARIRFTQGAALTCEGERVALDGSGSSGKIVAWRWDLDGDRSKLEGEGESVELLPTAAFTAWLEVEDENGCKASVEQAVELRALPRPAVAFTLGSARVCAGESVQLDASASVDADGNPVASYEWDLDGDDSTVESAEATLGPWVVTGEPARLRVRDAHGCVAEFVQPLEAGALPEARIEYAQGAANSCVGSLVGLDGSASLSADGSAVASYAWDLDGDASTIESNDASPPAFSSTAPRDVSLRVTDAWGCAAIAREEVRPRENPVADIRFVQGTADACVGSTVLLSGIGSTDADGNPVASLSWDMQDDGVIDGSGVLSPSLQVAAPQQIRLVATDLQGCTSTALQPIAPRALPIPVIAFAEGSAAICAGDEVALDGAGSRDADGNPPASFFWDLDGDPTTVESTADATGRFAPAGSDVTLRVRDFKGCEAAVSRPIDVGALPTARLSFVQGSDLVCAGDAVIVDAAASTDAAGNPVSAWEWDLDGDGSLDATLSRPAPFVPSGTPNVRLVVRDGRGCEDVLVQPIVARPLPTPAIEFATGSADACEGGPVALTGAGSRDADGAVVQSFAWDLEDDGQVDSTAQATGSFVPVDGQLVRLTITDQIGCTATATQLLEPRGPPTPVVDFVQGGAAICQGDEVQLSGARSFDVDGQPVTGFSWDLDGDPATAEASADTTQLFTPTGATATLTVTDARGCRASLQQPIDVGARPTARIDYVAGAPLVCAGESVLLDGSGSTAADGGALSWQWDLDGDPSTIEWNTPQPPPLQGDRSVRLRVADARGCEDEAVEMLAARPLPVAAIDFAKGAAEVCIGADVELVASGSRDADGMLPMQLRWDLDGDGAVDRQGTTTGVFLPQQPLGVTLTVEDSFGCVGTATQQVAPRALPTPAIAFAEGEAHVCRDGTVKLDASGSLDATGAPVVSYAWDLENDGVVDATTALTPAITADAARTARLRVVDSLGCAATRLQPITVQQPPTARITFAQGEQASCRGDGLELSGASSTDALGNPVSSFAWELAAVGAVDRDGVTTGSFVPASSGDVRLTVADAMGCSASATQTLLVRELPAVDAGADVAFCAGDSARIGASATSGLSYAWSPAGALSDPNAAMPMASPVADTIYTLTVRDSFGCENTDQVAVDVHPLPVADAGPDRAVARGGQVRLLGGASGGTPAWTFAWTPASTLGDAAVPQPLASPQSGESYTLRVTDAMGCVDEDVVFVAVRPPLLVSAGEDTRICRDGGAAILLDASTSGGVEPLNYAWTANPPCANCIATPNAAATEVSPQVPTTFTLTVTDANGTTNTDSVFVDVIDSISVSAGPDVRIQRGEAVQIGAPPIPGLQYTWTCDNWSCGISDPEVSDPWVAPEGNTAYRVTVTDGGTCTASDTVVVTMDLRVLTTVPTEGYSPWPRDALIWVIFDSDVDPSSIGGNVVIWDPSDGTTVGIQSTHYDAASRTLTIDPRDKDYRNNVPYVLQLKGGPTGIRTVGPNSETLYNDYLLQYIASSMGDGAEPRLAWSHPVAGSLDALVTTDVVVQFDEPVDPATVTLGNFYIQGVAATVSYDPRTWTATLRPSAPLLPNTLYTVRVQGVRDGKRNNANWSFTFTTGPNTDTTPPTVISTTPMNGAAAADVSRPLEVTFSEPIDPATLGGIRLIDSTTGYPVGGEVTYDERTRTASLDPRRVLEPQRTYILQTSGIRDQAGNLLAGATSATFVTQQVLLLERFESNAAGWTLQSPWATDYQGARAGNEGLVDSPGGDYGASVNVAAASPSFSSGSASSVTLSFWSRRLLASQGDVVYVEFSTNGLNWSQVGQLAGPAGWRNQSFVIPAGGAPQLRVRFRLQTNASVQFDGFFVDEVVVR